MTTILHVSDTHLGKRQYGSDTRRDDMAKAFDQAIEIAVDENVDAVIHTGDLFDSRTPSLPEVTRCIQTLRKLDEADIPFYGIVGNHDSKMDKQWLDLIRETGTAERLSRAPTIIGGDVAVYGIDSVSKPSWHSEEFTLEPPGDSDTFTLLCMHQLLAPPIPGSEDFMADHSVKEVFDRVGIELDALALGDYHKPEEDVVDSVPIWYAGSTERCSLSEEEPRSVSLLEIEDGSIRRRKHELSTREFAPISIEFSEGDAHRRLNNVLDQYDLEDKVAHVTLRGERTALTSSDVYSAVIDRGAAVAKIKDDRGRQELDFGGGPEGEVKNPDEIIDEQIVDKDLSETALSVDKRVRGDEGLPNSKGGVANEIENDIKQAQDEAFSDHEVDETEEVAE